MAQSSTGTEQDYLEDNIATVAYHLGRPGAKMRVDHQIGGLNVSEGEVLKEISRRLSVAQACADPVQDTYLLGGPPDIKAMSGSVESDRVIQLHFRRTATDADRAWLLRA